MRNLVRVSQADTTRLPVTSSTLYKWWHIKKYPDIFVKIGGALFVDLDSFDVLIEEMRGKPKSNSRIFKRKEISFH